MESKKKGRAIGFYGSSFDPITNVHLMTASTVAHRKKLDVVAFSPSSNVRNDKQMKTTDEHRVNMINLAIKDNPMFVLDTYELGVLPGMQYSYQTMRHLREIYPDDEIYFIMGADLLVDIADGKWSHAKELVEENKFIIMSRNGIDMTAAISRSPLLRNHDDGRFQLMNKGISMEISSTYIRDEFAMGGEPRYLLPDSCYEYIKENGLYKK